MAILVRVFASDDKVLRQVCDCKLCKRSNKIVRVDFYNVDGRIYFGELTLTSDCGIAITRQFSFSQRAARRIADSHNVPKH